MSWDELYGAINQMLNEAYEAGQQDACQELGAMMDAVMPNTTFSKEEIKEYMNRIGKGANK